MRCAQTSDLHIPYAQLICNIRKISGHLRTKSRKFSQWTRECASSGWKNLRTYNPTIHELQKQKVHWQNPVCDDLIPPTGYDEFFCLFCHRQMIAKQGKIRQWHFAHKALSPNCSYESYLHSLAKLLILQKLRSEQPFGVEIKVPFTSLLSRKSG